MENNFVKTRQINDEPFNPVGTSTSKSIKENLKEFKHCVLLHEKGLQMQDSSENKTETFENRNIRSRRKTNILLSKSQSAIQHTEDFQEVNELRMNFKERHQ